MRYQINFIFLKKLKSKFEQWNKVIKNAKTKLNSSSLMQLLVRLGKEY